MLRSSLLAITGAVALTAAADAADIYKGGSLKDTPIAAPIYSFQGFYIGGFGGAAWADAKFYDRDGFDSFYSSYYNGYVYNGNHTKVGSDGWNAGGTLGYNVVGGTGWLGGNWLWGIEIDLGYIDVTGDKYVNGTLINTAFEQGSGFFGDVTGRIGYLFTPRALVYFKGGFAFFNSDHDLKFSDPYDPYLNSYYNNNGHDDWATGWTVGGGFEYLLTPNWSIKGEYQYFDFGERNFTLVDYYGYAWRFDRDLTVQVAKGGINYHFTPAYEPLK